MASLPVPGRNWAGLALALAALAISLPAEAQRAQRRATPAPAPAARTVSQPVVQPTAKPVVSQPVVQPLPGRDGQSLNAALARLARNPRDVEALISAGSAALAMGDVDAAVGFYNRADQASPGNPRVKAGLASVFVRSENPFEAIPLFDQAEKASVLDAALTADRGLAYDLVGDNATAQRFYRTALANENNDEVTRRLALSFAIAGDRRSAEATLSPLLLKQDKAAWRTRAFALAILGEVNEAVAVAQATLPNQLAAGVSPYLRYMPRLTPAQQAAAANLGHFPRPSEIGQDDPRVAQYAPPGARRPAQASADVGLVPKGEPLGRARSSRSGSRRAAEAARTVPNAPEPSRDQVPPPATSLPSVAARTAPATPAPAPAPVATMAMAGPPRSAPAPTPAPSPVPAPAPAPARTLTLPPSAPAGPAESRPQPSLAAFDLARAPVRQEAAPAAAPAPRPIPAPAAAPAPTPVSVADAFSDFGRPQIDVLPASGAVDIRHIRPARPAAPAPVAAAAPAEDAAAAPGNVKGKAASAKAPAKPAAKPPPPSHPSRIWVQIATGRDKRALAYDWRRMTRESAAVFRGKEPFVSAWGQTNRLLVGPFPSNAAANAYMTQLRRANVDDAFLWTSPAGQVVDELPLR